MKHLEGKKLLFLGSNVGVTDMMRYARETEHGLLSLTGIQLRNLQ